MRTDRFPSPPDLQKLPLLLRGIEVAKELGISRALAYRWMQNGTLPVVRVPGSKTVRVPGAALLAWIESRTERPKSAVSREE
jgi:excisionase family DNA binding protein